MANRLTTFVDGNSLPAASLNGEYDNIYAGTVDRTAGRWGNNDDIPIVLGTSQDVSLTWNTTQTQDSLVLGLAGSKVLLIMEEADKATDLALAQRTNPAVIIHSADATTAASYIELQHDNTNSVINTGGGGIDFQVAGVRKAFLSATTLTLGVATSTKGALALAGNTSGTVTVQPAAAAGTWSLTLPTTGGTANYALITDGAGVSSWSILPLAGGGTAKALTASNGGIVYTDADSMEVLAGTATAGQILRSGASAAPTWSTATYPATTGANRLLLSTSANVVGDDADLTYDGNALVCLGTGNHAIGSAAEGTVGIKLYGTGAGANSVGTMVSGITAPQANDTYVGAVTTAGTITKAGSGTHAVVGGVIIGTPTISGGAAAVTLAASLVVNAAPTGASNNYSLFVAGATYLAGNLVGANTCDVYTAANISATGLPTSTGTDLVLTAGNLVALKSSSSRYKTAIQPWVMDDWQLEKLFTLTPISFEYIESKEAGTVIGFAAEDLESMGLPYIANRNERGEIVSYRTETMTAYLFEAIRLERIRLSATIAKLQAGGYI